MNGDDVERRALAKVQSDRLTPDAVKAAFRIEWDGGRFGSALAILAAWNILLAALVGRASYLITSWAIAQVAG